jgi:hypothetical protein
MIPSLMRKNTFSENPTGSLANRRPPLSNIDAKPRRIHGSRRRVASEAAVRPSAMHSRRKSSSIVNPRNRQRVNTWTVSTIG